MKKIILSLVFFAAVLAANAQQSVIDYELSKSDTFNIRVEMLMLDVATQVCGEDTSTYSHAAVIKRHNLVQKIYAEPVKYRQLFVKVLSSQSTLTESSTDSDIEWLITSIFNDLAGVKFDD